MVARTSTSHGDVRRGRVHGGRDHARGHRRRGLQRRATVGGAALLGALALPARGRSAATTDADILNYALTLEYLQASFYTETERIGALTTAPVRQAARALGSVERAHVRALRQVLGKAAVVEALNVERTGQQDS